MLVDRHAAGPNAFDLFMGAIALRSRFGLLACAEVDRFRLFGSKNMRPKFAALGLVISVAQRLAAGKPTRAPGILLTGFQFHGDWSRTSTLRFIHLAFPRCLFR